MKSGGPIIFSSIVLNRFRSQWQDLFHIWMNYNSLRNLMMKPYFSSGFLCKAVWTTNLFRKKVLGAVYGDKIPVIEESVMLKVFTPLELIHEV